MIDREWAPLAFTIDNMPLRTKLKITTTTKSIEKQNKS
jgi:hypothetical protein